MSVANMKKKPADARRRAGEYEAWRNGAIGMALSNQSSIDSRNVEDTGDEIVRKIEGEEMAEIQSTSSKPAIVKAAKKTIEINKQSVKTMGKRRRNGRRHQQLRRASSK